ncbi:MAG TPA: glucose-6-phosphate isomerase [Mycobacteriales bacterium]|nr:glucose-6-phosphate isomerase [Mycobacteriales bacterium]
MSDFPTTVAAGGVSVSVAGESLVAARDAALADAVDNGVPAAIVGKDATIWGAEATSEASVRLGWLDCVRISRPLVAEIEALRDELRSAGVDRVVLAGMGGSSLAPEVITGTYGADLVVLDTTDPGQVQAAITDLDRTVLVASSKSGGTVETDSHRRAFEQAFRDAGIDPAQRIVVVTDAGSPFEKVAREASYRVFLADPDVGGRYSALTAFGLVPSGLAGVPIGELLDQAAAVEPSLADDSGNPALALGAALGGFGSGGHDKLVIADGGSGSSVPAIRGFGDWAEQLIAESTGKNGHGLLPVVVEGTDAPGFTDAVDVHRVVLGASAPEPGTAVEGPLGAQFLVWEYATAVAGRALGINPFDQPNVQESKDNTKAVLEKAGDGPLPEGDPAFVDGAIEVHVADNELLGGATTVAGALSALVTAIPVSGYLAVMAYLDRLHDAEAARLRALLASRTTRPVTFGWGPRFLHSTGQYHKGGPQVGAFLQVTGAHSTDLAVPGQPFTFGRLQLAQALGDLQALESRDRPVMRLHLTDRAAGLAQLLAAASA